MAFPQFYLHYDTKNDKTLKVDRSDETTEPFVTAIKLEEEISKRLLDGSLTDDQLIVNPYANPAYVIDKSMFPKQSEFYVVFAIDTLELQKVVVKEPTKKELDENKHSFVRVDTRVAYSILANDTTFDDWKIVTNNGTIALAYAPRGENDGSALFKNRIDFLSFAEIDTSMTRHVETAKQRICEIDFDYAENSIEIRCANVPAESFNDFFLAITNKNDPSFLIKLIQLERDKTFKLNFRNCKLSEMSFFTSRFHLRSTNINILNNIKGEVKINVSEDGIVISNDLHFGDTLPEAVLVLKNKYDSSIVYRTITLKNNKTLRFSNPSITPDELDVFPLKISKNFISIFR